MGTQAGLYHQAAALSVRNGRICLVTARDGKRWVVPKGWSERGKTLGQIALQEAWEEAGLLGVLEGEPAGSYLYKKGGRRFHVTVFRMHVTKVTHDWPEKRCRQRRWMDARAALARISERGLRQLLRKVFEIEATRAAA